MTAVERKSGAPATSAIRPGGYTVFDLSAWYQLSKATYLAAGLYNIGDKKHTRWSDVRGLSSASLGIVDAFTQTGRNFAVNLVHNF